MLCRKFWSRSWFDENSPIGFCTRRRRAHGNARRVRGAGADGRACRGAQCRAGAWGVGGRLQLGGGHPAAAGRGPESHRRAKPADVAGRFRRRDASRLGTAGRSDRAGRPFLGRHRHQRDRDRPEGHGTFYVAARAPDAGEDFVALSGKFPTGAVRAGIQEHDGFTRLSEESFLKYFANGVEPRKAEVLYAVQEPTAPTLFGGRTTVAAWRSKPSWYSVSKLD